MHSYRTDSSKETRKIAAILAKRFLAVKARRKKALVFGLIGDLGTGKTTFVQGFLRSLGIKKKITSPTFILMKKIQISKSKFQINSKIQNFKNVYHIDCYRIRRAKELLKLGLKEILANHQNIVLIEWAEKIQGVLPKNAIWIKFEHGQKENMRIVKVLK